MSHSCDDRNSSRHTMKLRLALAVLSIFLTLSTSADRKSNSCAVCWRATDKTITVEQTLGVNIHFTDAQPGELKMIASAGVRWIRMDFVWADTETVRGRYDFSAYDRLMQELAHYNIRALFILDYGNPLYTEGKSVRTAEAQRAFALWAAAAAKHFARRGVVWELFNEPNVPLFWPPQPNAAEYNALAQEVGRAFREAAPNETLIAPATLGIEFGFLESCFRGGLLDYSSAVSVHPYRKTNPESAAPDYARLRELIGRFSDRPHNIISSEWGYSSVWRGVSEEQQAGLLTRLFVTNAANGIPITIWYDWRDDGEDANEPEHHFGLVRSRYHSDQTTVYEPKPAYLALKTLSGQLNGYHFIERLAVGSDDDYVLVFEKASERRIVAWTTQSSHDVKIPDPGGTFLITTATGQVVGQLHSVDGRLSIKLSPQPLYLAATHTEEKR